MAAASVLQFWRGIKEAFFTRPPPINLTRLEVFQISEEQLHHLFYRHERACAAVQALNFGRDICPFMARLNLLFSGGFRRVPNSTIESFNILKNVPSVSETLEGINFSYRSLLEDFYSSDKMSYTYSTCSEEAFRWLSNRPPYFKTRTVKFIHLEVLLDDLTGPPMIELVYKESMEEFRETIQAIKNVKENDDVMQSLVANTHMLLRAYCLAELSLTDQQDGSEEKVLRADLINFQAKFNMLEGLLSDFEVVRTELKEWAPPPPEELTHPK